MGDFHSYMWSVPDWRTDDLYTSLDNREQGIYRNLIDECWVSGSIPADIDILARSVHEPVDYFIGVWAKIVHKFQPISNGDKLLSRRLERDRKRFMLKGNLASKKAKKAAETRWAKARAEKELHATSNAQALHKHMLKHAQIQTQNFSSSPSPNSPSLEDLSSFEVSAALKSGAAPPKQEIEKREPVKKAAAKKRELEPGAPPAGADPAADHFAARHLELTSVPYLFTKADFVWLAKLRKAYGIGTRATPTGWEEAVTNYFASPLSKNSMADLITRYSVFRNSPLNQYKTPVNHTGGKNESPDERRARLSRESDERVAAKFAKAGSRLPNKP